MPVWLACLLLALDIGVFAVLQTKCRERKRLRAAVRFVCALLAIFLLAYLILTALFLNAASHH